MPREHEGEGPTDVATDESATDEPSVTSTAGQNGNQLTLKLTHPNCWMREVTAETDAQLLVNAVYIVEGQVKTHVVAYAESRAALEELVRLTHESEHTVSVTEMYSQHDFGSDSALEKKAQRSLLVEYDPAKSIHDALVSRGFMPQEPIRIRDGWEYWTVAADDSRETIQEKLETVQSEGDAEITVQKITSHGSVDYPEVSLERLSDRQREVFELARELGYYDSPRQISGTDLAEELGISKTTVHEHLRKVEATLLGSS